LRKTVLTEDSLRQFTSHIAGQGHAMAGATIAASAALACGLGEACVRISALHLEAAEQRTDALHAAEVLAAIRGQLLALADEDGAAITAFAALREAGLELAGQERLCRMPIEMGSLAAEAAALLQDFRPLVRKVQDDLEMAITLLAGATRAAGLLLDSNLRLWPEPVLLAKYEPELAGLRAQAAALHPFERVRP
jgi:formiminotetrahydrofolate cyclodeaminase